MENEKSLSFKKSFLQVISEDMTTASTGMGTTGTQFSADTYAPGDNRMPPTVIGSKSAKGKKKTKFPIQRRPKVGM